MQTCVSAPPQLQRGHGHFHQLDSAYNAQLLHQTGPNEIYPAPGMGAEMTKINSIQQLKHTLFYMKYTVADIMISVMEV